MYTKSTLLTLQDLVQFNLGGRDETKDLTLFQAAINWAYLLAGIIFKPSELSIQTDVSIASDETYFNLAVLTNPLSILHIRNTTDSIDVHPVTYPFLQSLLPSGTSLRFYAEFGTKVFIKASPTSTKTLKVSYSKLPTKLSSPTDTLEFGEYDAFIVSVATGICWAALEEGDSATMQQNVATFLAGPWQVSAKEHELLRGQLWALLSQNSDAKS